jgi:hypothetical protein
MNLFFYCLVTFRRFDKGNCNCRGFIVPKNPEIDKTSIVMGSLFPLSHLLEKEEKKNFELTSFVQKCLLKGYPTG